MAVDDQYPPRVLLFRRNGQGILPLQPHGPHLFGTLHHPAMFLNNEVAINSRKRKEVPNANNLFSLQHHRSPQTPLSTALQLGLNDKQPPQKMGSVPPPLSFTSLLTEDRYAEIVEQSDQIDEIIKTHADQLRRTLADKWRSHYLALLRAAEERASKRLKERELELEKSVRRNAELEQRAAQFSAEAQVWRAKAEKMEEAAAALSAALREATVRGGGAEDAESSYVDPERVEPVRLACKACEKQVATVMMWPCRHVCVCRRCDVVTHSCPVCLSLKTTSIEVFLP